MLTLGRLHRERCTSGSVLHSLAMAQARYHFSLDEARKRTGVKWTRYPKDVIPLWVADMDFPVAEPILETLRQFLDVGDLGYTHLREGAATIEAAARWFADQHGYAPDPSHAAITSDVMQAVAAAISVFTEPGDGIIVLTPIYPPFPLAIKTAGRRFLPCPLTGEWAVDLEHVATIAKDARAVLLSSPHNPSGRAFTPVELEGIAAIAARHDLIIISDEIHADLVYDGFAHLPTAVLPEAQPRTLTIMAASKSFNIAGIGCGVVFFGSAELAKRFAALPSSLVGHPRAVNVRASAVAWQSGTPWLHETKEVLAANRAGVDEWARRNGIGHAVPEATYLAWLDFRDLGWEEEPYDLLLRDARVALSPGLDFGPDRGFARLNFATSPEILRQAFERMDEVVGRS